MAEEKSFYWLKFQKDFFKSLRIKKLRKLAGGDTFTIIYLKLQLLALTTNGYLEYKGVFETFEEEMEEEIGETADNIKITVQYLLGCGLMEQSDNMYYLPYVAANTGKECASAGRVRDYRDRKKQLSLQCNGDVTESNEEVTDCNTSETEVYVTNVTSNTEKEIEKEIDIDKKEIYKEKNLNQQVDSVRAPKKQNYDDEIKTIFIKWNTIIGNPKVSKINAKRRKAIINLLKDYSLEEIIKAIEKIHDSDFLMGRTNKENPFHADFDFLLKQDKFLKILEGAYDNRSPGKNNNLENKSVTYSDMDDYEKTILSN